MREPPRAPGDGASLQHWLDWQCRLHPRSIDLGLERIRVVWQQMGVDIGTARVVSIAGTNGKGSCAAALEALTRAGGQRVGCFTSPHLWRYNERIRIDGRCVDDAEIIRAFERIDQARGDVSLSYFEFGTLAALWLFAQARLDLWILEVGLGGRLDAVNLIDADLAIVTSVGLDHAEYLGTDLEQIAAEKLAIGRRDRKLLAGDTVPSEAMERARGQGMHVVPLRDLRSQARAVPVPPGLLASNVQLAWLAAKELDMLPPAAAMHAALAELRLPGRCERRQWQGLELILDVAHNREAAAHLAEYLRNLPPSRHTCLIFAALADKPVEEMSAELDALADQWLLVPLSDARALSPGELDRRLRGRAPRKACASVSEALQWARRNSQRAVVWGSFLTVAQAGAEHG